MKRRGFLSGLGGLLGAIGLGVKPDVPEPTPPKPKPVVVQGRDTKFIFNSAGEEQVVTINTLETIELPNGWVRISKVS